MTYSGKWLGLILLLGALALCGIGLSIYQHFYHDDAYISLRYVQNFLHGQGLVWNVGERVEGYSNFLWVILVSLLGMIGVDPVAATKALGVSSLGLIAVALWFWGRRLFPNEITTTSLAILIVLSSLPMIVWSIGGLEPVLFALLLLLSLWAAMSAKSGSRTNSILTGILFALLSMTRPDGPLYLLATLSWLFMQTTHGKRPWRVIGTIFITFAVCFGSFLLWRYSYYGDLLPNPYYVKGSISAEHFGRGLKYLYENATSLPYLLPLAFLGLLWIRLRGKWADRHGLIFLMLIVHCFYVAVIGGDHMPAFRFMVPIIALCAIIIADTVRTIAHEMKDAFSLLALAAVAGLVAMQILFPPEPVARAQKMDGAAFLGRIVGEYINTNFPKGSLIALNTAGSTPYYAPDHRFIDMLGLNDRTIAKRKDPPRVARWQEVPGHEKGDARYVLSRRPDYIIAGGAAGYSVTMGWFLTEYELARMPEFGEQFEPKMVVIPVRQYLGYEQYEESESGEMGFAYYQRRK